MASAKEGAYLVTGGTGFIGSLVARQLADTGAKVVCYDWNVGDNSILITLSSAERARLKIVQGDVRDLPYLINIIREEGVSKIMHLGYLLVPLSENPSLAAAVNVVGTNNVFEAARILNLQRVVWASSAAVWGQFRQGTAPASHPLETAPLKDDAPHHPTTLYGATKSLNETMARRYYENYGVDIIGLRLGRTFGVGKTSGDGVEFLRLLWKVAKKQPLVIQNPDFIRTYTHGEDVARAFILASQAGKTKTRIFNTQGFDHTTNRQLVETLKELRPDAPVTLGPSTPGAFPGYRFNSDAIKEELGYTPRYSLKESLKMVLDAYSKMSSMDEKRRD